MTTPLLPYENRIIAALASGSVTQAAIQLGIPRSSYYRQLAAITQRIIQAGGDPSALRATLRDCHHNTRSFSRLRGRHLAYAKTMIDGNELVRERE